MSQRVAQTVSARKRKEDARKQIVDGSTSEAGADPFPGGPTDRSVLKNYENHIAYQIWNGKDRPVLKLHNHASGVQVGALESKSIRDSKKEHVWDIELECKVVREKVEASGLLQIAKYSYQKLDRDLITAFTERWHEDTNTFHMPFGEMTITLEDVHRITELQITGHSVHLDNDHVNECALLVKGLGVTPEAAEAELKTTKCKSVRMLWLREICSGSLDKDDARKKDFCVRGYLLHLMGSTLFCDKSGSKVPVCYLTYLMDLTKVPKYSWGTAVLSYLYRQLGHASTKGGQMAGYLPLLQAWIDEHFKLGLSDLKKDFDIRPDLPLMGRWTEHDAHGNLDDRLVNLREMIDDLEEREVIWDPYRLMGIGESSPPLYAFYSGCIVFDDIVEPYQPERVLRQFGVVQHIPSAPMRATKKRRSEAKDYGEHTWYWENWEHHVLNEKDRSQRVSSAWEVDDKYAEWFSRISHPKVQNPNHRKTNQAQSSLGSIAYYREGIRHALAALDLSGVDAGKEILHQVLREEQLPEAPERVQEENTRKRTKTKAVGKRKT